MTTTNRNLITVLLLFISCFAYSQEICDNAIDDDGDGFIDLNDEDCICQSFSPSSLIPNPSFEDMTCCPTGEAQLDCAVDWIQASTPTTDYLHTCGITSHPFLGYQMPLPPPDGEGGIGFRDGKPGVPNFKEYAGACLTSAMTPGTEYMLDFFVGFHDEPGSTTFDMALFATTDCNNLPFGGGDQNFGCPTNGPGWIQLGTMTYSGVNEWVNVEFSFMADQPYEAIVLGPDCAINPNIDLDPYFFFDNLVLAESVMFGVPLADISGNICTDDLVLTSSDTLQGSFQWYKDGVAIIGETGSSINLINEPGVEGVYEVVVSTGEGCFNGEQYVLTIPSYASELEAEICDGDVYEIGDESFDTEGDYEVNLIASDGCDSLVSLSLSFLPNTSEAISEEICAGDSLEVNGELYTDPGEYEQTLEGVNGCDSMLIINLLVLEGTSSTIEESICSGETFTLNDLSYSEEGMYEQSLINSNGCDSTIFISLIVLENTNETLNQSICQGESFDINGESYSEAGEYIQTLEGANGCDSILTINLSVDPVLEDFIEEAICDGGSIEINAELFEEEGDYVQNFTTDQGCDSIVYINISLLDNPTAEITETLCLGDSLIINGEAFTEEGSYEQVLVADNSCDSILTVNISLLQPSQDSIAASICSGEGYLFGEDLLEEGGMYEITLINAQGCDSIIHLNLELLENSEASINVDICEGDTTLINGEAYYLEGEFSQTLVAENGCDSTLLISTRTILNCDDCRFNEEADARQFKLRITRLQNDIYQASISLNNEKTSYSSLSKERLLSLMASYCVEKERLQNSSFSSTSLQMHASRNWKETIQISKNDLAQVFNLPSDVSSKMNMLRLNSYYVELKEMTEQLRVEGSCSYK